MATSKKSPAAKTSTTKASAAAKTSKASRISKPAAEKALAWHVLAKNGLPRGEVVKLLQAQKVDPKIVDRVASALVPYGHTA